MPPLADLIQQGSNNLWLFIPSAILLGALHGLEPGHSKTMMAAFIIAIRGTVVQAVLLGLCAALSHSLVVWLLAAAALEFGNRLIAEQAEPWFMLLSGAIVIGMALWMAWRTRRDVLAAGRHDHVHRHHGRHRARAPSPGAASLRYRRHDPDTGYQDAHAREHAEDIRRRFAGKEASTAQIALFGLTGGLLPCPASVTLLMICLHLKRFALGAALVLSFSAGLAIALVGVGVVSALAASAMARRSGRLGELARRAPYLSSILMLAIGSFMLLQGARHLAP
ncbi:nickel/cobalt efflux transporter [Paludibacterium paludis]|uniref:Nickel/cobalt efflux system n=1 Tax=Paludibacterium paludis TaxID=1225769 RepID=A0A918P171_9NEIS|nr:nickel/cobalt efflux transporter [Paludibacterium paludis]GGY11948.1 nickel/cobalt efflux system [Paludibacterium paludis]